LRARPEWTTSTWNEFAPRATARPRPDRPDVAAALHAAGFIDVRDVGIAVHLPVSEPQTCGDFHLSHGFTARVEAPGPADAAEFRRHALAEPNRMHESGDIVLDRGAVVHLAGNPAS
jgi:hypothetical protein